MVTHLRIAFSLARRNLGPIGNSIAELARLRSASRIIFQWFHAPASR